MAVISDEHGRLPSLLPHRGWETLFHRPVLPGVPASAIRRTPPSWLQRGSSYRCLLSMVDGLDMCEASMIIPLNHTEPWTRTIFGNALDTTIEQMTHVALTSLFESPHRYRGDADHTFPD
jgi:hypothetical protein